MKTVLRSQLFPSEPSHYGRRAVFCSGAPELARLLQKMRTSAYISGPSGARAREMRRTRRLRSRVNLSESASPRVVAPGFRPSGGFLPGAAFESEISHTTKGGRATRF